LSAEQESSTERILIIDDQPESIRLLTQLLDQHGNFRVFSASSANEGISLVARRRPDLIILDLRMPAKDGFAVLDELRDGPLDKHGGGSRILDVDAKVHEDEIARLAGFGKDRKDPAGGIERGLTANEIDTYMKANIKRDGDAARWYFPILMKGEWPVLLKILGKGNGEERYLSVDEVRTLFVEKRLPERIVARLPRPS
jgi:CheY-like chemotaxis protein